nr:hypothetical protein [Tanacetum cinerariifolium]
FEEEILAFIHFLGHSAAIRTLTDVNISKLYKPWRSFATIINKCLTGKSPGYDSLRLSQAQILWGLYHKRNLDYAYLMWEDFIYQVEHKDHKKSNEMYYPRFTKVIIHHFMSKDPSIPRRNKVNWHYVRDDHMFSTIKLVSKYQNTQQFGAAPPKPKASIRKTRSSFDTTITPPTTTGGPRLTTSQKVKQAAKASKAKSLAVLSDVAMMKELVLYQGFPMYPLMSLRKNSPEIILKMKEEEEEDELYKDVNINQGRGIQATLKVEDSHVTLTPVNPDEFMQTNQFAGAVYAILRIVQRYIDQRMNEAVQVAIQLQSDKLREEAQKENDEFLKTIDENMQNIIKDKVKEQVKTSYVVAADLSAMELKNILIEKMEGNKSIQRSNEQRNLYKALVEAYESDKIILDTYGETVTLKRRRDDDADKEEKPSAGSDRGSKRRREGNEPESASAPTETATRSDGKWKSPHIQSLKQKPPTPDRDWNKTLPATHGSIQPWISELAKRSDSRFSFNELMDTPLDFSNFLFNRLKVDTLTLKFIVGPTYELLKGSCKSLVELEYHFEKVFKATSNQLDWVNPEGQQYPYNLLKPLPLIPNNRGRCVIPFDHFINNDLEYLRGDASSRKYTTSVTKTKAADYGHIKWIEDLVPRTMWIQERIDYDKHALWRVSHWGRKRQQFYGFAVNRESTRDVYSKRRIIAVTELKIVEWHNYKHLDWIMLTNLTVEERFGFNVSLRMFTKSIVIQRRVEDLQLGVKSYQKKLNLTKPDTDGTLTDVRTALDDRLKGIQMQYLPQSIWRKSDKDRVVAMIQAIDKRIKTRRIMRSLERFVGERLYEGDFRMLQRTI